MIEYKHVFADHMYDCGSRWLRATDMVRKIILSSQEAKELIYTIFRSYYCGLYRALTCENVAYSYDVPYKIIDLLEFVISFVGHGIIDDGDPGMAWITCQSDFDNSNSDRPGPSENRLCTKDTFGAMPIITCCYETIFNAQNSSPCNDFEKVIKVFEWHIAHELEYRAWAITESPNNQTLWKEEEKKSAAALVLFDYLAQSALSS